VLPELFPAHHVSTGDGAAQVPVGGATLQLFWADAGRVLSSSNSKSGADVADSSLFSSLTRRVNMRAVVPLGLAESVFDCAGLERKPVEPTLTILPPQHGAERKTEIRGNKTTADHGA
jgi:hypothetical protein